MILHKRNKSSLSSIRSSGFGSDTLSPPGITSPGRIPRFRTASQDSVLFGGKPIGDTDLEGIDGISQNEEGTESKNPIDYIQLVVMFDGADEEAKEEDPHDDGMSEESKNEDQEVIDRLTFALVKQEGSDFTFRIVCSYCKSGEYV